MFLLFWILYVTVVLYGRLMINAVNLRQQMQPYRTELTLKNLMRR